MDIKTFVSVAPYVISNSSALLRGPHGIGKSELAHQVGKDMGLPVVDRRLSQMSEGDMIGLPELVDGVTRFCPPDWYARACREPVILLLDEINRATPEVMQSAFQLVLDRELNGHKLHSETLIFAAVNASADYQVNEMDPALLDRFWVVDLEPTVDDWIAWAQANDIDPVIVDFIRHNNAHLRHAGSIEPGKVYPSPRSYTMLDRTLKNAGMVPTSLAGNTPPDGFYAICTGFIGNEASISFQDHVKTYELRISAEDILDNIEETKPKLEGLIESQLNGLSEKVTNHCKENEWTVTQCSNIMEFAKLLPGEMMVALWNSVMETGQVNNITKLHKFMGQMVVEAVTEARGL